MTTRKRPTSCLIFGVLNLVFGTLSILSYLCCSIGGVAAYFFIQAGAQAIANDRNMRPEEREAIQPLMTALLDMFREFAPFLIALCVLGCLLSVVWIISGVGLVRVRQWGRWWAIGWGVCFILLIISSTFWSIAHVNPMMMESLEKLDKALDKIEEQQRARGINPPPRQRLSSMGGSGSVVLDNLLGILIATFEAGYALLLIVWMALPQTAAAIAAYNRQDGDGRDAGEPDNRYDDEYERQRRRELEGPTGPDSPGPA
jgi:hypothetical protein